MHFGKIIIRVFTINTLLSIHPYPDDMEASFKLEHKAVFSGRAPCHRHRHYQALQGQAAQGFGQPGQVKGSLPMAGGLEVGDLQGPFQAKPVYDFVIRGHTLHLISG